MCDMNLTVQGLGVTSDTTAFNIKTFYPLPNTAFIPFKDPRTNRDYFPIRVHH